VFLRRFDLTCEKGWKLFKATDLSAVKSSFYLRNRPDKALFSLGCINTRWAILGFHLRDETATLCKKQWQNVAQVFRSNRIKFPKDFFRYCSVHQHGRRDVT